MLFYQLSDLHFVAPPCRPEHKHNNERFLHIQRTLLGRAKATKQTPPVLICGDVVDTPSEQSFSTAKKLLGPLREAGYPLHFVPGNHDLSPLGISWDASGIYTKRWKEFVSEMGDAAEYPTEYVYGDTVIFGVDSSSNPTTFARGEVGVDQLYKLRKRLDFYRNQNKRLVVMVHHHPFDREFTLAMIDYGFFMQEVYSRADVLLFGHKHRYEVWKTPEDVLSIPCMPLSIQEHYKAKDAEARLKLIVSAGRSTARKKGTLQILGYQAAEDMGTNLVPMSILCD